MKHTTVMIEEETLLELNQLAGERSTSASQLVREALAEYVLAAALRAAFSKAAPCFYRHRRRPNGSQRAQEELLAQHTDPDGGRTDGGPGRYRHLACFGQPARCKPPGRGSAALIVT